MKLHYIDEPELEFGGAGRHIDIRHGLTEHGPLDSGLASAPQVIRVGVVGAAQDAEQLRAWIDRCRSGVDAKKSKRTTLFVGFPGFGASSTLCDFVVDDRLVDTISGSDLRSIGEADDLKFQVGSIERFRQGAADLIEKANAHVVLCLLPETFVRRIDGGPYMRATSFSLRSRLLFRRIANAFWSLNSNYFPKNLKFEPSTSIREIPRAL
jgi:hypothetical protein